MTEPETTPRPKKQGRQFTPGRLLGLPTLIAFGLSAIFIGFLLTRFDIDFSATWGYIKGSHFGYFLLAFFLYYLTFPARGLRWRILLDNVSTFREPGAERPSVPAFSEMILMSWFANSITWFRLGDAYRAYLLAERSKASFPRTVGTVAAERVLDVGVVFVLLLVASIGLLRGEPSATAKAVILAAAVLAALVAAALVAMKLFGMRLARRLPTKVQHVYARFEEGTIGSFRQMPVLLLLSTGIWLLEAARLYFVVKALGFDVGISLVLFAALAHSLLTTIPLTPGGLGFVELGLTGLLALSLRSPEATAVTLLDRSITYLSVVVIGGAAFALHQVFWLRRRRRAAKTGVATEQRGTG